jgi:hypothetical protein
MDFIIDCGRKAADNRRKARVFVVQLQSTAEPLRLGKNRTTHVDAVRHRGSQVGNQKPA